MTRARRSRWLSIADVTDVILQRSNRAAARLQKLTRRHQIQHVRRLVLRAERRDDQRITKRVSGDIYVRFDALEALLPLDVASVTRLEVDVVKVASETKKIWRHVGGHGAQLRDHSKRIGKVEKKQELFARFQAELQAIDAAE